MKEKANGAPIYGHDLFGKPARRPLAKGALARAFLLPPFSVLNAREGSWQARKRAWLQLGIRSELGRGGNLLGVSGSVEQFMEEGSEAYRGNAAGGCAPGGSPRPAADYGKSGARGDGAGRAMGAAAGECFGSGGPGELGKAMKKRARQLSLGGGGPGGKSCYLPAGGARKETNDLRGGLTFRTTTGPYRGESGKRLEGSPEKGELLGTPTFDCYRKAGQEVGAAPTGTSVFDPVLCELLYQWFCPAGGQVVDPFAGGSVRGVVAACLGLRYWGSELSAGQVAANKAQLGIVPAGAPRPVWLCGDARERVPGAPRADFILTCPPYGDLEQYSDDPRDISTYDYPEFRKALGEIMVATAARLRNNRYAAWVVGDFRGPGGNYRNFPAHVVGAAAKAGLGLYNEFVLVTAVGSLPIRAGKQFAASRKAGRTHQSVLVFAKGAGRAAARACGGR